MVAKELSQALDGLYHGRQRDHQLAPHVFEAAIIAMVLKTSACLTLRDPIDKASFISQGLKQSQRATPCCSQPRTTLRDGGPLSIAVTGQY